MRDIKLKVLTIKEYTKHIEEVGKYLNKLKKKGSEWGLYDDDTIRVEIHEGRLVLWGIWFKGEFKGILTTRYVVFSKRKAVRIEEIAGEDVPKEYWGEILKQIEEWASISGYDLVEVQCRWGFKEFLKKNDYKLYQIVMLKEV